MGCEPDNNNTVARGRAPAAEDDDLLFVEGDGDGAAPPRASEQKVQTKAQPGPTRRASSPNGRLTRLGTQKIGTRFVYVPTWDAYHKVLSTYYCLPVASSGPGHALFGHDVLPAGASDVERAEFDKKSLDQVIKVATQLQRNATPALISFAVDYASLSIGRSRDLIVAAFRTLPKSLGNMVTLQISNVPDHIPTTTLGERVGFVKPYFRAVTLQVPSLAHNASRFSYMGLHALIYRLSDSTQGEHPLDFAEIANIIKHAKAEHLQFGFGAVADIDTASRLATAGATYLSGPFTGPALDMPAAMRRCTIEQIAAEAKA